MQPPGAARAGARGAHARRYEVGLGQPRPVPICTGLMHLSNHRKFARASGIRGYRALMTNVPHDQDADPPTPDGQGPDREQLQPDSQPASDPDPDPDAGTTPTHSEEDA
jgi:hypothetical protein